MEIEPYDPSEREEVLALINRAFGFPPRRGVVHLDGPWGPSTDMVARDQTGIVGVRLLLPWLLQEPDGVEVPARRAVEASTLP